MRRWTVAIVLAAVSAVIPGVAAASNGVSCGATINGDFTLTHDLVDCPGDGLIVGTSGITINLGGYTIDGDEPPGTDSGGAGVRVPPGVSNLTIRNGTIAEFSEGVVLDSTTGNHVSRLTVVETTRGINLANASANVIEKNSISLSFLDGIRVNGAGSDDNVVTQNLVTQGNLIGITVSDLADRNLIDRNVVNGARWGIAVFVGAHLTTVSKNDVSGAWETGIQVDAESDGVTVARNKVSGNEVGIFIKDSADDAVVLRNQVFANIRDGIRIAGDRTRVERNQSHENGGWGINVMTGADDTALFYNDTFDNGIDGVLDNGTGTTHLP